MPTPSPSSARLWPSTPPRAVSWSISAVVPFIDSAGLGALIGGIRRIRENEGRVVVYCNGATLLRLLHTTGFDRIVPVEETLEAAVGALDRDPGI